MNYIDNVYNKNIRPYTTYPQKLCTYLNKKYLGNLCWDYDSFPLLLDLGCGRGEFSRAFRNLGFIVESFDKEYNDNFHRDLSYTDNIVYDVIFTKSVIEHINNPKEWLKEWKVKLSKSGKIIILTPNWQSQFKIFYDDPTHITPFTKEGLKTLMQLCDFRNVHTEIFYQLPITWKFPIIKKLCKFLSLFVKPEHYPQNKFIRWSTETMILGVGDA